MTKYGINPANLHEFSKDVVSYFGEGNFDVINELKRVSETLKNFSMHSPDTNDMNANALDDVVLSVLIQQYEKVKGLTEEKPKQSKPKDKEQK